MRRTVTNQQWAVGCLAALAVPVLLVGLWAWAFHRNTAPRPITLADLSRRARIRFPPGTRLTHGEYRPPALGPPCCAFARLLVAPRDVDRLVQAVPQPRKVSRSERLGLRDAVAWGPPAWWHPEQVPRFIAVRSESTVLLISRGKAPRTVVYLFYEHG